MRILPKRTATRLVLALTMMVALIIGGFTYYSARKQERALLSELLASADQISRGITAATQHAMKANRRQDAYAIMKEIGKAQGIDSIRIFNKEGYVTFSTDPKAPRQVDKNAEACFLCHARSQAAGPGWRRLRECVSIGIETVTASSR
jgi:two-component system NtrC family sensor kinase